MKKKKKNKLKILLMKGQNDWYFNIVSAGNGKVVATSEMYSSKSNAIRAMMRLAECDDWWVKYDENS